jgi:hypothetical protein
MPFMRSPLSAGIVLTLLAMSAYADDYSFTGYARSLDTGELLYVESHAVIDGGSPRETRVVLYRCAVDSAPFARKQLEYFTQRTSPAFTFEDARSGFAEGFERNARSLTVFERAGSRAPLRREAISPTRTLVVDAGFDEFVREQWESLERGAASKVPFLVPSLLESVTFRVRKVAEVTIDGETASVIRLSLAGALGWFLPDIDVSYRKRDRRLMRYRGLTNIRDAGGELLKAQIDFPEAFQARSAESLANLMAQPLTADCR